MTTLTPDQEEASKAFFRFLMSEDSTFVLSGQAGSGKTYLMSYLIQNVMKTYRDACTLIKVKPEFEDMVFTATTNTAAEVLEKSIGKEASTIHSYLSLKVYDDYKTGKTKLSKTPAWKQIHNKIVFIDEASMVDQALYAIIMESFVNSKIIFVGDPAQMAPISEKISPIFTNVADHNYSFLRQSVRNANSPALMSMCAQLRESVYSGLFHPMVAVPGVIEYLGKQEMQEKVDEYFVIPRPDTKILCFTNSRVMDYNAHIRVIRGLPPEYIVGDTVVFAKPYMSSSFHISADREAVIKAVGDRIQSAGYEEIFADHLPIEYREYEFSTTLNANAARITIKVALDPDRLSRAMKYFAGAKNWPAYFDLKNDFADIRGKDSCTVYKTQGGTLETVFMDLGNIGTSYDAAQVARMLFVGVSRATTRVFFFGRLPYKYIGV